VRIAGTTWPAGPLAFLVLALLAAALGPLLPLPDPYGQDFAALGEPPSAAHLLGTDEIGGDVLARLLLGCRLSLTFGLFAALVALATGGVLGMAAMAIGGAVEVAAFAVVDLVRAMPGILFALAMVAALEPGTLSVVLALGLSFAPTFARIVASTWRREQAAGYVAAARCFGAGRLRTAFVHILPNLLGPLVTQFAIVLPRCIVSESVLSFIGLGVSPETPTWGRMISAGALNLEEAPHALLAPVIALALLTWALSMLADRLRRVADPLRRRAA
jgi:ABC-type dipeptide/oligopeptide/nickel transport system permease subunit